MSFELSDRLVFLVKICTYICIFVAYTISDFDQTAVNVTISEILTQ